MRLKAPSEFELASLDHLDESMRKLFDKVLKAVESGERLMVIFYGPAGTGKTYIAAAFAHELERRSYLFGWVNFFAGHDMPKDPPRVMFLDDIGRERKEVKPDLIRFLAGVTDDGGVTIGTTNRDVNPEEKGKCALQALYGEAVRSRVLGNGIVVEVNGPDRRFD